MFFTFTSAAQEPVFPGRLAVNREETSGDSVNAHVLRDLPSVMKQSLGCSAAHLKGLITELINC